ncbi:MAG: methyltransferase domain-containing protein [Candidatus Electrothrix sp. AR4]|nr:methyltransferase domain-containing protein [Candidatus Electrothrix sp. AR4]
MREGFKVTALEPTGVGFSHFDRMRAVVAETARAQGVYPTLLDISAEMLAVKNQFDYAFSINVMEHVDDVERVLKRIGTSLCVDATYRFTCPNYLFPYEPHFNIPTLFFKKLTAMVLRKKIFGNQSIADPFGTWKSLNWINVILLKRYVRRLTNFTLTFNRSILVSAIERIVSDTEFARRRSPAIRRVLLMLVRLRLHIFFRLLPTYFQPIMDCRMEKKC